MYNFKPRFLQYNVMCSKKYDNMEKEKEKNKLLKQYDKVCKEL